MRDELERIVREYRHLRAEHLRARRGGRTRRHLGARLKRLDARFERLLRESALGEQVERQWRDHLHHAAPEPVEPAGAAAPLVFRGRSAAGSELRLVARDDGSLDAYVDDALVERIDAAGELAATSPRLTFRLEATQFAETFVVSATALDVFREALEGGAPLAPSTVAELVADGIVDEHGSVTARGRRALGLDAASARRAPGVVPELSVRLRGRLPARARPELEQMLERVAAVASATPVHARASLVREDDPALERPVHGEAQLELPRRTLRAHVAAASAAEAVALLEARLRRNLLDARDRAAAARTEGRPAEPGRWRHGDLATTRPPFFDRPVEQRRLVRRMSYAPEPLTPEEAAWEMRALDHDFLLFVDAASGKDALVHLDDGAVQYTRGAPTLDVDRAVARLDATQERFVFFVDAETSRGAVVYRRYDGHYGLVTPAPPG